MNEPVMYRARQIHSKRFARLCHVIFAVSLHLRIRLPHIWYPAELITTWKTKEET